MNWEGSGRKLLWPNLMYRPEIRLVELKKRQNMYWEQPNRGQKLETAAFRTGRRIANGLIATLELWRLGSMGLVS